MLTPSPFDDLYNVISQLPPLSKGDNLNGPGTLEGGLEWLKRCQRAEEGLLSEAHICVFASTYEATDVTAVQGFVADASQGKATVNRLCVDYGVGLRVLELAAEMPHEIGASWTEQDCMASVAFGMEATAAGGHLLGLSSLAPGGDIVTKVMIKALQDLKSQGEDDWRAYLEAFRQSAGREVAACVGAIIAAKSRSLPVVIDCWAGLGAVYLLECLSPNVTDHVLVATCPDGDHEAIVQELNKARIVGLHVNSGAGCGSAVAVSVLKAAVQL